MRKRSFSKETALKAAAELADRGLKIATVRRKLKEARTAASRMLAVSFWSDVKRDAARRRQVNRFKRRIAEAVGTPGDHAAAFAKIYR